ncbi:MAG TPA: bifunctional oligoribonuclease/PAP phosphatase NrnA [bacterium]|nr:bifunctional oligoribonuclease/PAP phosphatase NrnA [bacterium]
MFDNTEVQKFKEIWEKISTSGKILLISHLNPDIDALSSLGALIEILKENNKEYIAWAESKDNNFNFLPNSEEIISQKEKLFSSIILRFNQGQEISDDFFKFFDLVIILDCGSIERTSLVPFILKSKELNLPTCIVEFDHHLPTTTYADIEIRIPLASTTEILYHFLEINNIEINRSVANCLLAGILSDTANFLYPSVSGETLAISSKLMIAGAQFPKLLNYTWRNKNFFEMKLLGLAISNLKVNKRYNLAFSIFTYDDLEKNKINSIYFNNDIFSDIIGFLSNLAETNMVMLLREDKIGQIKGSLRVGADNGLDIDSTKLAAIFGGGGHKKASGFVSSGHIIKNGDNFSII